MAPEKGNTPDPNLMTGTHKTTLQFTNRIHHERAELKTTCGGITLGLGEYIYTIVVKICDTRRNLLNAGKSSQQALFPRGIIEQHEFLVK